LARRRMRLYNDLPRGRGEAPVESWIADIEFERPSVAARVAKKLLVNPIGNYMPAKFLRGLLRFTRSELAKSNWTDPGGWRSMVISYDGSPE